MKNRKIKLSEERLIQAIRERHPIGARALYDMYSASLFGVISRIIPDVVLAEDVLQESILKIWNVFDHYDPDKGRLFTWMINLTRNLAVDNLRHKSYRQGLLNTDLETSLSDVGVPEPLYSGFDKKMVKIYVECLPKKERVVLDLIYFRGFKHTEVAETLAMPLGSVKTTCRAAIARLRRIYANDEVLRVAS